MGLGRGGQAAPAPSALRIQDSHQYLAKREEEANKTLLGRREGQEEGRWLGREALRLSGYPGMGKPVLPPVCSPDTRLHPPGPSAASPDYCWVFPGGRSEAHLRLPETRRVHSLTCLVLFSPPAGSSLTLQERKRIGNQGTCSFCKRETI